MVDVLLGLQWGDEGKGKIVDYLATGYDVIARFQGGPNAGHTLYVDGKKMVLRTIPSGVFHDHCANLIGNGVVLDPVALKQELDQLVPVRPDVLKHLFVSQRAHLILPTHRALDAASEAAKGAEKIGSTLKGIGPAYMDKTGRNGLRIGDLQSPDFRNKYARLVEKHERLLEMYAHEVDWRPWEEPFFEACEFIKSLNIVNAEYWLSHRIAAGQKVLAEGAQGSLLDIDYGTYPFVTSSNTVAAGVCSGLGVAPGKIRDVYGITKAYCTRVGSGPFPTELDDATGEELRRLGNEFGAVTGRSRRCGWIDLVALRYTVLLSGVSRLVITKADVLDSFNTVSAAVAYNINGRETNEFPFDLCNADVTPVYRDFPGWERPVTLANDFTETDPAFQEYMKFIEHYLGARISFISNGTERDQLLVIS